ncbi:MAG: PstS family phosphate ABC transporter substrate-binding protein [Chloroflexota bacterium]
MRQIMRGASLLVLLALFLHASTLLAQDDQEDEPVTVVGSRLVLDAVNALADETEAAVDLQVNITGTVPGFEAFCGGTADVVGASRPISVDQETACEENGITYAEYLIGYDVQVLVVNAELDFADCIAPDQLATIFAPSATNVITDWAQTGFSVTSSIPLSVVMPPPDSAVTGAVDDEIDGFGIRADVIEVATAAAVVETVAAQPGAIGVTSLANAQNDPGVRILEIRNTDLGFCQEPTLENIESGAYTLADPLYLYVNVASQEQPGLRDFLAFVTDAAAAPVLADVGFIAPSEETSTLNQAILAGEEEAGRQFTREAVEFEIPDQLFGTLSMAGAASLANYLENAASVFNEDYANVTSEISIRGQPTAIRRFCSGELDVIVANRDLVPEERTACENNTVNPVTLDIGAQAVVLVANAAPDDAVEDTFSLEEYPACLTTEEVVTMWQAQPSAPEMWQQINPDFPEKQLTLLAPQVGSVDYTDILLSPQNTPPLPVRLDVAENRNDPLYRAAAVANVRGAVTYMSWVDYLDVEESGQGNIQLLAIDAGNGCVTPTSDTIADGTYPYSVSARLIISETALARTEVQSFVWYLFQDDNYFLFNNAGLTGIEFGALADIRAGLQDSFETALATGLEPDPTTPVAERPAANIGPELPFDLLATPEPAAPEATPETTEEAP